MRGICESDKVNSHLSSHLCVALDTLCFVGVYRSLPKYTYQIHSECEGLSLGLLPDGHARSTSQGGYSVSVSCAIAVSYPDMLSVLPEYLWDQLKVLVGVPQANHALWDTFSLTVSFCFGLPGLPGSYSIQLTTRWCHISGHRSTDMTPKLTIGQKSIVLVPTALVAFAQGAILYAWATLCSHVFSYGQTFGLQLGSPFLPLVPLQVMLSLPMCGWGPQVEEWSPL